MAEKSSKVRPTLTDLEVGKTVTFPIEKTKASCSGFRSPDLS